MNASASDLGQRDEDGGDPLPQFSVARDFALDCDAADILARFRRQFELPVNTSGQPLNYLCGHSLGLAPRAALDYVSEELADWAALGVGGHHTATRRGSTTRRTSPRACSISPGRWPTKSWS